MIFRLMVWDDIANDLMLFKATVTYMPKSSDLSGYPTLSIELANRGKGKPAVGCNSLLQGARTNLI